MAQIPLGDFAQARAIPRTESRRMDTSALDQSGRGLQVAADAAINTGQQLANAAVQKHAMDTAEAEKAKREAEAIAAARATVAVNQRKLAIRGLAETLQTEVAQGADYNKAHERYTEQLRTIEYPIIEGLRPDQQISYDGAIKEVDDAGRQDIDKIVAGARRADGALQFVKLLDSEEQLAGAPGADPEASVAKLQASKASWVSLFGLDPVTVEQQVSRVSERIRGTAAANAIHAVQGDVAKITQLSSDIETGAGSWANLTPQQRITALTQLSGDRAQLERAQQQAIKEREAAALAAVKAADDQVESLIPPTPEMLQAWVAAVQGTPQEAELTAKLEAIKEVQTVQGLPLAQQQQWLNKLDAKLAAGGGSPAQKRAANALRTGLEKTQKDMKENPLDTIGRLTNRPVNGLDLSQLATDPAAVGAQLKDRMNTLRAARQQGYSLDYKPLLEAEATAIAQKLETAKPEQAVAVYQQLFKATDAETYDATLKQLGAADPVYAAAGRIAVYSGAKVATRVLRGAALLSGQSGKAFKMPPQKDFDESFFEESADIYAGNSGLMQEHAAAARAIYADSVNRTGDTDAATMFDGDVYTAALKAVRGEVAQWGGRQVLAPFHMDPDNFEDEVGPLIANALKAAGVDGDPEDYWITGTKTEGRFILMSGLKAIANPKAGGVPIFFDVKRKR